MRTVSAYAAALIALVALAAPSFAEAQHVAKGKKAAAAAATDTSAANDGASTTPADDTLRTPTAEEMAALADSVKALVNDDATGLTPKAQPDGSVVVDLDGRFQSVAVAVKRDGKVEAKCVASSKEADDLRKPSLTPAASRPAGLEEK